MKKNRGKKGSTLAELCISMALLAIVATLVVTFSVLADRENKRIIYADAVNRDLAAAETIFRSWMSAHDDSQSPYVPQFVLSGLSDASASPLKEFDTLTAGDDVLSAATLTSFEAIESVTFSTLSDALVACTVYYKVLNDSVSGYVEAASPARFVYAIRSHSENHISEGE